jgi:hypothetical protein
MNKDCKKKSQSLSEPAQNGYSIILKLKTKTKNYHLIILLSQVCLAKGAVSLIQHG